MYTVIMPYSRKSYICKIVGGDIELYLIYSKKKDMYQIRCFDQPVGLGENVFSKKPVAQPKYKTLEEAKHSIPEILNTSFVVGLQNLSHKKPRLKRPIKNKSIMTLSGGGGPGTGKRR